jgi:hypothetical protein
MVLSLSLSLFPLSLSLSLALLHMKKMRTKNDKMTEEKEIELSQWTSRALSFHTGVAGVTC